MKAFKKPEAYKARRVLNSLLEAERLELVQRTKNNVPFNTDELDSIIKSFRNIVPAGAQLDESRLKEFIEKYAHMTHKVWEKTDEAAKILCTILNDPSDPTFQAMFQRVLNEGGYSTALQHARTQRKTKKLSKPWVVLVTGLNGIRKTTAMQQPWFETVLHEALASQLKDMDETVDMGDLPTAKNSFFRQLDFMVATIANEEFRKLYKMKEVGIYAKHKDAVFARYRTMAEILGMLLCKAVNKECMNCLVETSGRDIAMFEYIDYCFPAENYNKLVVHFTINDISFAERSVDKRMKGELLAGQEAAARDNIFDIIQSNAGGPYGSAQLKGVQEASDITLGKVLSGETELNGHWYKARIAINASEEKPWTCMANVDGGSVFAFDNR